MKYDVTFEGNWMQLILRPTENGFDVIKSVADMEDSDIRLYAESDIEPEIDEDGFEDDTKMYDDLVEQIKDQASSKGLDLESLAFYYDIEF